MINLTKAPFFLVKEDIEWVENTKKAMDEYEENNNPIIGFIKEIGLDSIVNEPTKTVYRKYKEYCIANNFQALSNIEFSRQITKRCGLVIVDKWISRLGKCRVFVESEDAE